MSPPTAACSSDRDALGPAQVRVSDPSGVIRKSLAFWGSHGVEVLGV